MSTGPNLRKVYWDKGAGTIWTEIEGGELTEDQKKAVVRAFEIKSTSGKKQEVAKPKAIAGMPTLIPIPRSNNISIMLSRFPMNAGEIVEAISKGDPRGELTLERLAILLQCEPTQEELDLMRSFTGDAGVLTQSEKFLMDLSNIERLGDKIAALVYARQFPELIAEAHAGLDAISAACTQVKDGATGLRRVLAVALRVGNFMNAGGPRTNMSGVTLDSLHKLTDVRTTTPTAKGGVTLLDFVVELVDEQKSEEEEEELELTSDISACQAASRIARVELEGIIRKIAEGAEKIKRETEETFKSNFNGTLAKLDEQIATLQSKAERVNSEYERFAELFGESRRAPEDVFASLWAFACAVDASRAARKHRESKKKT